MLYILFFLLLLPGKDLFSADTTCIVKGRVYDNLTLEPLPAANVLFGKNQGAITDLNGNYIIRTAPGSLSISFQFVGYKTISKQLHLKPNETLHLDIRLEYDIAEIDQIVISAGKTEQKISELTVSMTVIRPESFATSHISDAQEIINKSSGIEVLDGQASIRGGSGFSYGAGSRVMALIDGLPVLSADAGNIKWQFLPLESLNQIEIIKGASSVLYGSSAINGIINFRTADAGEVPVTKFYTETGLYDKPANKNWVWWDTPRIFSSASFSHLRRWGNTDIGISTGFLTDKGYRKLNDERLARVNLKIKQQHPKQEALSYGMNINGGMTSKTDFILWENAVTGALKQAETTAQNLHGSFIALDPFISYKKPDRYQHELRARIQSTINDFPDAPQNNSDALSFFAEYQLQVKLHELYSLNIGLTENFSRIKSDFYGYHNGFNLAGYSQLDMNPTKRLKMVAGVRLEINSLNGKNDRLVPLFRSGLNYKLFDYTYLRTSFGQGYRYPSVAEKHASTTIGGIKIFPNLFIQPESGWNSEVGIKQGILTGHLNGQVDLALFYSQNKDMIEYQFAIYQDPGSGLHIIGFRADNIEHSRVYGYEIEFLLNGKYNYFHHSAGGGYTFMYPVEYSKATRRNTGEFLKYRRKHSGKINFTSRYRKFETSLNLFAKSKILNIDNDFLGTISGIEILPGFYDYWKIKNTGYFMMDLSLAYHINPKYKVSLAVKNFTNTEYMGRPGDIMPQRNFSLRLSGSI